VWKSDPSRTLDGQGPPAHRPQPVEICPSSRAVADVPFGAQFVQRRQSGYGQIQASWIMGGERSLLVRSSSEMNMVVDFRAKHRT
jgi:hypothetical protein